MRVISDIVELLGRGSTVGVLGIEGPPYAGKTTIANQLAARYGFLLISEHTVFEPRLESLARAPWPIDEELVLERQREFLRVEMRRSLEAVPAKRGVVMDRTLISIIAHLYLRTRRLRGGDDLLGRFLDECAREVDRGSIVLPQSFMFLPACPNLIRARAQSAIAGGDQRMTEPFLLRQSVLVDLNEFYRALADRLLGRVHGSQPEELTQILKWHRDALAN